MMLRKMKETAEAYLGIPVTKAIISAPAHFQGAERNAIMAAGQDAGLKVYRCCVGDGGRWHRARPRPIRN